MQLFCFSVSFFSVSALGPHVFLPGDVTPRGISPAPKADYCLLLSVIHSPRVHTYPEWKTLTVLLHGLFGQSLTLFPSRVELGLMKDRGLSIRDLTVYGTEELCCFRFSDSGSILV